jgi:hypothetical protein
MKYIYKQGDIPIIILSIHGGTEKLTCNQRIITKENNKFIKSNDLHTKEIAYNIFKHMKAKKCKPYLLINKVHRKYVDLNRNIPDACGSHCLDCKLHYYSFHDKLSTMINTIIRKYNKCLIFDVHGNKHSKNMVQLGYHITLNDFKRGNLVRNSWYSLNNVKPSQLNKYVYNEFSITHYLHPYLKPTNIKLFPENKTVKNSSFNQTTRVYYSGSMTVMMNYKDICDVVLVELSPEVRKNKDIPNYIASGLCDYYNNIYININNLTIMDNGG